MFIAIYEMEVYPGMEDSFRQAWEALTRLIYQHAGSLGSRLHRNPDGTFIAYAQWPDRQTWEDSPARMPEEAEQYREVMRSVCSSLRTIQELEVDTDLLQNQVHGS